VLLAKTLRSSTLKLALISIGVFGVAIIALFGYVYWSTADYVRSRSDRAVAAEYAVLQGAYARGGRDAVEAAIAQRISDGSSDGRFYLLADSSLRPLAGNVPAWPPALAGGAGWDSVGAGDQGGAAAPPPLRRVEFATLPNGDRLLVAKDIDDLDQYARRIRAALAASLLLVFVLAGFASVAVTRRTVGRIEGINAISRAIMESGLGKRIALRGTRDEWDQLAQNLNSMLDRIEALMGEVKQVTDNVAHDLRTPLTRLRARLEKAGNAPREPAADRALINDTLAELDGVLRMFAALTRISQIEAGERTAAFRAVNLADIAREVAELYDAAAEEKGTRLAVVGDADAPVHGDRDLLFDAVANLVDNAIKHGRDAGRVSVDVRRAEEGASVVVADDGPGIPAEESQHVFKRFYRLERSRRMPGNGLGLSLVAAVARLHGARIEMVENAPGLTVRLQFSPPAEAARDAAADRPRATKEPQVT
jgi:signal transduction histidine kinase